MKIKKILLILGLLSIFSLTYGENETKATSQEENVKVAEPASEESQPDDQNAEHTESEPVSETVNSVKIEKKPAITPKKQTSKGKKKEKASLSEQLDSNISKLEEMLNRF